MFRRQSTWLPFFLLLGIIAFPNVAVSDDPCREANEAVAKITTALSQQSISDAQQGKFARENDNGDFVISYSVKGKTVFQEKYPYTSVGAGDAIGEMTPIVFRGQNALFIQHVYGNSIECMYVIYPSPTSNQFFSRVITEKEIPEVQGSQRAEYSRSARSEQAKNFEQAASTTWAIQRVQNCDDTTRSGLPIIGVPSVYMEIRGNVAGSEDLSSHEVGKNFLRQGKLFAERQCQALAQSHLARGVDVTLLTPRFQGGTQPAVTGAFRYGLEANNWRATYENHMALLAEQQEQGRRQATEQEAQRQWWMAFVERYKVDQALISTEDINTFIANPFPIKGKTLGFAASFIQMLSERTALFGLSNTQNIFLTNVPPVRFTKPKEPFFLAGIVQGIKEVSLPSGGKTSLPEIGFIGAERFSFPQGLIGVEMDELPPEQILDITGVRIKNVLSSGPADKASLRPNDIILYFNGKRITSTDMFKHEVKMTKPNTSTKIKLLRDGKEVELVATIGEKPVEIK